MRRLVLLLLGLVATSSAAQVSFESSNLPILVIDTDGAEIPDEPRIDAHLGVIDNGPGQRNALGDPFNGYDGLIGIEVRGSGSQTYPKNGYAVETRNPDRSNNNVPLLGMPSENDWVLYGPYLDKSLVRNALAYDLARSMGRYASRVRFCELVLNGEYYGVYAVFEKIKRDDNRIDIARLRPEETEGDDLTGGYILKIDHPTAGEGWYSPLATGSGHTHYQYHDPNETELVPEQEAYARAAVDSFETFMAGPTLDGLADRIDIESFVDYIMIGELSRNVDGYRLSTFFYKDKDSNDGRFVMGPVWDFNLAFGNSSYLDGANVEGLFINTPPSTFEWSKIPFWWPRLLESPVFSANVRERWQELREGPFHPDSLDLLISDYEDLLDEAQARNFEKWDVLGTYVWPNAFVGQTYAEEMTYLRSWVRDRAEWLDGAFASLGVAAEAPPPALDGRLRVFPNPAATDVTVELEIGQSQHVRVVAYDVLGRPVAVLHDGPLEAGTQRLSWEAFTSGVYLIRAEGEDAFRAHARLTVTGG